MGIITDNKMIVKVIVTIDTDRDVPKHLGQVCGTASYIPLICP